MLKERDKDNEVIYIFLAKVYIRERKYGKASEILKSIQSVPKGYIKKYAETLVELGDSAKSIGYIQMAKESYSLAFIQDSFYNLGSRFLLLIRQSYKMGDCERAILFSYHYLQEQDADTNAVFSPLLSCLYSTGRWDDIVKLRDVIETKKNIMNYEWALGEALFNLGVTAISNGENEKAKMYLREFTDIKSPKILLDDAYFYLGTIFESESLPDSAIDNYYLAMQYSLVPKSTIYKQARQHIMLLKNDENN